MNDQDFIGLDIQDALESCQAHGIDCRIECEDDEHYALTMDYRLDRLNFTIEDRKVIFVYRG